MSERSALVGRRAERERLLAALAAAREGHGSLVLLSGEAGVGKSRLAAEVAEHADGVTLTGAGSPAGSPPYGPLIEALREYLRGDPHGLDRCGPLARHLALVLPELGEPPPEADRATLLEAVRCALKHIAADGTLLLVLDDLQWSDQATLALLSGLAIAELPVLVLAAYRSDGLPRDHAVRRLRLELRRAGRLNEIALGQLDAGETGQLLESLLGAAPSRSLAQTVHDRTQGVPFFVEELAGALALTGALVVGRAGVELAGDGDVPIPETVRDAVAVSTSELSEPARLAAETAAVAGGSFDVDLVAELSSQWGLTELLESGLVRDDEHGQAEFRHALVRDAVYAEVPWLRRRQLHRAVAEALEAAGAPARAVAQHWLGAREGERARDALLRACAESQVVHAFRDAAAAARQALELWPEQADDHRRTRALTDYAHCAELGGELAEAGRAWRELAEIHESLADVASTAAAQRHLAAVHDLLGARDAAFAARQSAADGFVASGAPAEAAVERLAMANQLRLSGRHREAIAMAGTARAEADAAARIDLRARALGLEGMARAKSGRYEEGVEMVRGALAIALEHELTPVAAELYQRLSVALYDSSDYRRAEEALETALDLCRASGEGSTEVACVSCLAYVLRERGDWPRSVEICHELIASGTAVFVAEGLLGAIHTVQGRLASARRLLSSSLAVSTQVRHYNMRIDALGALARVALAEDDAEQACERSRAVLRIWEESDDHHYATGALRWSAVLFATHNDPGGAHACVDALSRIASATGYPDALAALGHAIAETALAAGDADTAAEQLVRAFEHHRALDLPFQRAEIGLRAGVALAAAGERDAGLEHLVEAYRCARRLGARPLAAEAAREVAQLGESVVRRLGQRGLADADQGGLTRRELEVVRLVAVGRTNAEIAHELFLSRRTVDMHVRNILRKLDCRSRLEAAGRAGDLGLLV